MDIRKGRLLTSRLPIVNLYYIAFNTLEQAAKLFLTGNCLNQIDPRFLSGPVLKIFCAG